MVDVPVAGLVALTGRCSRTLRSAALWWVAVSDQAGWCAQRICGGGRRAEEGRRATRRVLDVHIIHKHTKPNTST